MKFQLKRPNEGSQNVVSFFPNKVPKFILFFLFLSAEKFKCGNLINVEFHIFNKFFNVLAFRHSKYSSNIFACCLS